MVWVFVVLYKFEWMVLERQAGVGSSPVVVEEVCTAVYRV